MNNPSPTPRTDACPHCGERIKLREKEGYCYFECGTWFYQGSDYVERSKGCFRRELSALKAKLDRAREALRDVECYERPGYGEEYNAITAIQEIARQTLSEITK